MCGGTHVHRLGDIGLFTILSESAVAAGVRRIEALTSEHARRYLSGQAEIARDAAAAIKTPIGELSARVAMLSEERRRLERELAEAKKALALAGPGQSPAAMTAPRPLPASRRCCGWWKASRAKDLKSLADGAKSQIGSGVVAFVATADGKASIVVGVTDDLTARISAVDLVRVAAEALGGKGGGGRPDMAQAGGPDAGKGADALAAIEKRLGELRLLTMVAQPTERRFGAFPGPALLSNNIRQQRGIDLRDLVLQLQLAFFQPRQRQLIAAGLRPGRRSPHPGRDAPAPGWQAWRAASLHRAW